MKILLIHNKYQEPGGEDAVFQAEEDLLIKNRHSVEKLVFDNAQIRTAIDKLLVGLKVIFNPASARVVKAKIREFEPDIIHLHNFFPLASPSVFFVARKYRIPVIVTLHNYRLICPSATLFHENRIYENSMRSIFPYQAILKGIYRDSVFETAAVVFMTAIHSLLGTWQNKVDLYITLTHFSRNKFLAAAIGIPERKLLVKPNFIKDYGRGNILRQDYFLFVGRLTEEKGIRTLLEATRHANFKLVIIGDGPLKDLVCEFAHDNQNIAYLGRQDKAVVIEHMKACKGLIFPSVWYEGFPITILEALCTGTIIIASKLGAMAEIIEDGVNGLHFEPGNPLDLIARIEEINSQAEYIRSLSGRARLTYLDNYTPDENYTRLIGIYNRALSSAKGADDHVFYEPMRQGWL